MFRVFFTPFVVSPHVQKTLIGVILRYDKFNRFFFQFLFFQINSVPEQNRIILKYFTVNLYDLLLLSRYSFLPQISRFVVSADVSTAEALRYSRQTLYAGDH